LIHQLSLREKREDSHKTTTEKRMLGGPSGVKVFHLQGGFFVVFFLLFTSPKI